MGVDDEWVEFGEVVGPSESSLPESLEEEDDQPEETDEWFEIDASEAAIKHIRDRGGRLFVWFKPVGRDFLMQKVSTSAPLAGPMFDEYDAGDFGLLLESEFDPPPTIRIRLRRWWPFQPLAVSGLGPGVAVSPPGDGGGDGERRSWPSSHVGHGGHGGHGGFGGHGGHGHGGNGG
jgi:hypothetical protein